MKLWHSLKISTMRLQNGKKVRFCNQNNLFEILANSFTIRLGHFHYAKYIDSVLRTRVMELEKRSIERFSGSDEDFLRSRVISNDRTCQKYLLVAMKHYAHALSLDMKHLYQALPREYIYIVLNVQIQFQPVFTLFSL